MKITRTSMVSGKTRTKDLNCTQEQLDRISRGELIQNVLLHLTSSEREFILTGITDEEWDELYPEED